MGGFHDRSPPENPITEPDDKSELHKNKPKLHPENQKLQPVTTQNQPSNPSFTKTYMFHVEHNQPQNQHYKRSGFKK